MTIFGKILLGLILATAAVLLIKGAKNSPDDATPTDETVVEEDSSNTPAEPASEGEAFKGSLKTLIARGGNYKCMFQQETEMGTSTGTVYVSGKEMRGDFTSIVTGVAMTVESHMISDGEYMYTWSGMMPTGMKMKVDATPSTTAETNEAFNPDLELDYKCDLWTKDASLFNLPQGITFTEVKAS